MPLIPLKPILPWTQVGTSIPKLAPPYVCSNISHLGPMSMGVMQCVEIGCPSMTDDNLFNNKSHPQQLFTIHFSGWDNVVWHPILLNTMFTCPNGDVLLGVIDTMGEHKDVYYICNALARYIEIIRVHNIVQICINNISNMWNEANLFVSFFPNLYFQGCVVHCLNMYYWKIGGNNSNCEKGKKILFLSYDNNMHHLQFFILMRLTYCFKTPLKWDLQPIF
jgi:hypothetical protein